MVKCGKEWWVVEDGMRSVTRKFISVVKLSIKVVLCENCERELDDVLRVFIMKRGVVIMSF